MTNTLNLNNYSIEYLSTIIEHSDREFISNYKKCETSNSSVYKLYIVMYLENSIRARAMKILKDHC